MDGLGVGDMGRPTLYECEGCSEQSKIERNGRRGHVAEGLHGSHGSRLIVNPNLPHVLERFSSTGTGTAEFHGESSYLKGLVLCPCPVLQQYRSAMCPLETRLLLSVVFDEKWNIKGSFETSGLLTISLYLYGEKDPRSLHRGFQTTLANSLQNVVCAQSRA